MTEQEKQILLADLCARLPYGVKVRINTKNNYYTAIVCEITRNYICVEGGGEIYFSHGTYKPYLRPMFFMTDEEFGFLQEHLPYDFTRIYSNKLDLINDNHLGNNISIDDMVFLLDCLNKWHLDYRGLIPMGLALEAPEGMYK